jgi:glycosyltransferase involved in cell wall biosynthesis
MALLRGLKRANPLAIKYLLLGRKRLLSDLAPLIDQLLVSGPSELAEIQAEFPALHPALTRIVPHPVDFGDSEMEMSDPYKGGNWNRHFFIGGRIESRKNQNAVLRAASELPDAEFVFAGQLNETDPSYCAEFQGLLAANPNCRWVGQLTMPTLFQHLAYADAVVSPSWFEVMSLINLYGHALGTPIVSAMHTYDPDLLQKGVTRYDPEAPATLVEALRKTCARDRTAWNACSGRLTDFSAFTWAGFDEFVQELKKSAVAQ